MKTTIVNIEGNKIQVVIDNDVQEYELADWVKQEYIKLGDADITVTDGIVTFVSMNQLPAKPSKPTTPGAKKSGKWEDDMVTFEDLLTKAHNLKVPFSIKTNMLAVDLEKSYALFHARVEVGSGETMRFFEGHGDATEQNVTGDFIKPHFIRMAETRAIVRALRWYTNNGCAEEEK